jgi:hypothetical protein
MEKAIAKQVLKVVLRQSRELEDLVRLLHDHVEIEEFEAYRSAIAEVLASMLLGIINPVLEEHEDLVPHEDLRPRRRQKQSE